MDLSSFFDCLNQFKSVILPLTSDFKSHDIQKIYPNVRFRWNKNTQESQKNDQKYRYNIYEGEFKKDDLGTNVFEGKGVYIEANGNIYNGEWKNNMKHGKGHYKFHRIGFDEGSDEKLGNAYYDDEWKRYKYCNYLNGFYEGEWKDDKMDGKGYLVYLNNGELEESYEGEFREGFREGFGIELHQANRHNRKYEGEWKKDNKDGKGIEYYSDGSRFEGEWKNGNKNGFGI